MKYKLIKFLTVLSLMITLTASAALQVYGAEEHSWYIKRNGHLRPDPPSDFCAISEYNAYFVNSALTDDSDEKRIYLTFDVGYENGNVERILNILKDECVPAAFFLLDNIILKNTDLVKRMVEDGHLACNHTKNHKNLSNATEEEIEKDLTALENIFYTETGYQMSKFFRFPEGRYSKEAVETVNKLGYTTVFWSFGYDDWDNSRQPSRERAINKILSNTHNGAIILLHPTSKTNADILEELIFEWRKMGYGFGTLEELA